jgi:hypothetical protein
MFMVRQKWKIGDQNNIHTKIKEIKQKYKEGTC